MSPRLHLFVMRGWLEARVLSQPRWIGAAKQLLATRVPVDGDALEAALDALMGELSLQSAATRRMSLHVQLGAHCARVGLLHLRDSAATALSFAAQADYVNAWVRDYLHLQPASQVLRWQVLRNPRTMLVACVDLRTYMALSEFSEQRQIRFTSCVPAVMEVLRNPCWGSQTVVWTEHAAAQRDPTVQIIAFERGQPAAMWRGWSLPTSDAGSPEHDSMLQGLVRRFQANVRADSASEALHVCWPERPQ